jgi:hypothetical protein
MFLWCLQVKRECQEVVKREGIDKLTIEDLVQVTTESCLQPTHLKSCLKKTSNKSKKKLLIIFPPTNFNTNFSYHLETAEK